MENRDAAAKEQGAVSAAERASTLATDARVPGIAPRHIFAAIENALDGPDKATIRNIALSTDRTEGRT